MQTYPEIAIIVETPELREALMRQIALGLDPINNEWDRQAIAAIDRYIEERNFNMSGYESEEIEDLVERELAWLDANTVEK